MGGTKKVLNYTGDMTASGGLLASGWQSNWKALGFSRGSCPLCWRKNQRGEWREGDDK